jgi:hypothetical protein
MQYKTMVLELLKQRPQMYEQLRKQRMLLPALGLYARGLKASHEAQQALLSQIKPGSDPSQIASEALEIALQELEASLPPASQAEDDEPPSLAAAMAYFRRHTPPG